MMPSFAVSKRRWGGLMWMFVLVLLLMFELCLVRVKSFVWTHTGCNNNNNKSHRSTNSLVTTPFQTRLFLDRRKTAARWKGSGYKPSGKQKLSETPKSQKRVLTLTANGITKKLLKKKAETLQHVLTKAVLWKLFADEYPDLDLEIESDIGDPDYLPDVVGTRRTTKSSSNSNSSPHHNNQTGEVAVWGESGRMKVHKALDLMRRYPTAHIVHCRWDMEIETFKRPFEEYLEEELDPADASWWKGRFSFASLPLEVWDFIDEATGRIFVERSDLQWDELDLSALNLANEENRTETE